MKDRIQKILEKESYDVSDLAEIMVILRSENGCPWDREQDHKSIRNDFIEEVYEAVEAIDTDDPELLCEELGDVLMQVVFHARISEEAGGFDLHDVADGVCKKLILRHPHVFGDTVVSGVGDVLTNWDEIKQASKGRSTEAEAFDGVSRALPSLIRSAKLAKRAHKAGIPVPSAPYDFEKDISALPEEEREQYIGRALFALADAAKNAGINAEQALYNTCEDFVNEQKNK